MTQLCLENSRLLRGFEFSRNPEFRRIIEDRSRQLMVLYPGPRATLVTPETSASLRASFGERPATVIVIDGTWPQAKKMFRQTPELQELPWIGFETDRRSEYRSRRQPDPLCLSTIEAVHELIDALSRCGVCHPQPREAHHNLMAVFRFMEEIQSRCVDDATLAGYRRGPRKAESDMVPARRWERRPLLFSPK